MEIPNCAPLPYHIGLGFQASEPLSDISSRQYTYKNDGRYHNYFFNKNNWCWPESAKQRNDDTCIIIDGFSPNLKELHVGHLRNFCVALSLSRILPNAKFIAMLGDSTISDDAEKHIYLNKIKKLFSDHKYSPEIYLESELPEPTSKLEVGIEDKDGTMCYNGLVAIRSNGTPTYVYRELSLMDHVGPDYYITGNEQSDHFRILGLQNKHLPLELVVGEDGTKLSTRSGNSLSLEESLELVKKDLYKDRAMPSKQIINKLAWNIACCNMLNSTRGKIIKFSPEKWTKLSTSPGLYLSYTYARLCSVVEKVPTEIPKLFSDVNKHVLAQCSYAQYYINRAINDMEPRFIVTAAMSMADSVSNLYQNHRIVNGDDDVKFAVALAHSTLGKLMNYLGMHLMEKI